MPLGFFAPTIVSAQKRTPPKGRGRSLDCDSCGLYKRCLSPKMDFKGVGRKRILFISDAPEEEDDKQNDILVGATGKLFRKALKRAGIDFERDCIRINAVNCWPGKGDPTPTNHQIACCRQVKVQPTIDEFKPEHIVLLGACALQSFYGARQSKLYVNKFQGRSIPDAVTGAWVHVLFEPGYILRNERDKNLLALWNRDLKRLAKHLEWAPPEIPDPGAQVVVVKDYHSVLKILDNTAKNADWLVFDYECTGLLPYAPGHRILSISLHPHIVGEPNLTYSFPLSYPGHWGKGELATITSRWVSILEDGRIGKVAHNLKFEDMWSRKRLGADIENWLYCTMTGEHVCDNTQGITSLKHIAWTRYGVEGYDNVFKKYLTSVQTKEEREGGHKAGNHHHNKLVEMPLDDLLLYGGIDSVVTAWEYKRQTKLIGDTPLRGAYDFFHEAQLVFCDIQVQGVPVNTKYYLAEGKKINQEIDELHDAIMHSKEAKIFRQKEGRLFDYNSHVDMKLLLFTHLGHTPTKTTATNQPSTDAEVLDGFGLAVTDNIVKKRKLTKVVDTYFEQYLRESHKGMIYPFTNLHTTVTYRSSMDGPNLQNAPNRDKETKMLVRKGIHVPRGYMLMEPDYAGIEVCGMGWYSKDKTILKYLSTPGTDMHRDQAQALFKINPKMWGQLDKGAASLLRWFAKSDWVFPEFYGSWYKQCAENLWKDCAELPIGDGEGTTVRQHLGMSFSQFENHVRNHENEFWRLYQGVRKWQDKVSEEYQKYGYIETKLGFRYGGWMTRNNLYNYKIQGTAFHLLLWAMMQLHYSCLENGWQSYVMWQIHDSTPTAVWPTEQKEVLKMCNNIMVKKILKKFKWINTPLKVEYKFTEIDGTYADLVTFEEGKDSFSDLAK